MRRSSHCIVGLISLIQLASEHQRPNHQRGHGADAAYRKLCRLRSDGHWLWYRSPALPSVRFAASSSAIADSLRLTFFWFDYRRTLAYKQPTGLFALRLSLMRGANIIGSRKLAGHGIATISGNGVEHFLSGIHLTAATAGGTSTRNAQSSATTLNGKCPIYSPSAISTGGSSPSVARVTSDFTDTFPAEHL